MTLDTNDEILQDFLVEADEIMEGLNEQLVELETQPEDSELLNAIFRGFHTIKGGAGFLGLENMVAICHQGEDVFNILRQGERIVDADMMDTFLQVLDTLNNKPANKPSCRNGTPCSLAILIISSAISPSPEAVTVGAFSPSYFNATAFNGSCSKIILIHPLNLSFQINTVDSMSAWLLHHTDNSSHAPRHLNVIMPYSMTPN